MKSYPFIIERDGVGRKLQPTQSDEHHYNEAWLQELLRKYPEILPVAEIEPVFSPLLPIGREVSTESGPIDNLFISHRGYLVLVETKLWRNPEAKREVVAQAIDYGSSLSKWNYERLNKAARDYTKAHENSEFDLVDWVEKGLGPVEGGRDFFEESVAKNLRLGRFLTLIVGDKIRQPVVEMVKYVNKHPGLAIDVGLIELQCFWTEENGNWPLLVVPRVVARTEIVERSVVQVTVSQGSVPQVEVRQEKAGAEQRGGKRVGLTEEAFWELLKEQNINAYDASRRLIAEYAKKQHDGIEPIPKENSITIRLDIQGTGQKASLFFLDSKARLNVWPGTIADQIHKAGINRELANSYALRLQHILGAPKGRRDLSRPITEVDVMEFMSAVDEFVQTIQSAERNDEQ